MSIQVPLRLPAPVHMSCARACAHARVQMSVHSPAHMSTRAPVRRRPRRHIISYGILVMAYIVMADTCSSLLPMLAIACTQHISYGNILVMDAITNVP